MAKRGRPRYPDVLTPRESEVLALLREGLTNEQIAERLGVSRDGVKYHVSEILSKLGVATRQDAAAWKLEEARSWWLASLALLLRPLRYVPFLGAKVVGGALVGAAAAGVGFLVWGIAVTTGPALPGSQTPASPDSSPTAGVDAGTPTPLQVETREATEAILVYSVPPPPNPGTEFARVVDLESGAPVGEDRLLGSLAGVEPVPSNSPDASPEPHIVTGSALPYRPLAEFALGRDGASPVGSADAGDSELALPAVIAPNGVSYRAGAKSIVGTDTSGAVVAIYALPKALPIASPSQLNFGEPMSGNYEIDKLDMAESLLLSGDGHLLVFVTNTVNGVLVDLVTEKRLDLPSYIVAAATVGEDGYVYAILLSTEKSSYPYVLVQIDPKNMELKQQVETTVRQSEWSGPKFISLVATPAGDIFFYATLWNQVELPDVYVHTNVLLQLAPLAFEFTPVAVPEDLGQQVTLGVDGRIYFYAGPAESTVSAYDPATGELSLDLPELRTPPGTYIRALFVR